MDLLERARFEREEEERVRRIFPTIGFQRGSAAWWMDPASGSAKSEVQIPGWYRGISQKLM